METAGSRDRFLETVRRALGRTAGEARASELVTDGATVETRADAALRDAQERAGELMAELADAASTAGWRVLKAATRQEAASHVAGVARDVKAKLVMRSAHGVLDAMDLEGELSGTGARLELMAVGEEDGESDRRRQELRERVIAADIGVTGVDYAVAETGSCAIVARRGVSRLVSLLPPVHIAVVERGQVLPSLDELFLLRRNDHLKSGGGGYMNIISGPSRSADIEQTLVQGMHGPREVYMVLLG